MIDWRGERPRHLAWLMMATIGVGFSAEWIKKASYAHLAEPRDAPVAHCRIGG